MVAILKSSTGMEKISLTPKTWERFVPNRIVV
jgi:hypothetical protein